MIPHARFEAKYILDHFRYYRIRNALSALCRLDRFSQASPDRCYLVRTLYFDTVDYNAYSEKLAGTYERNKIRIRSYSRNRDEALVLKAEQKRRFGKKIVKYVSKISLDQYDRFMQRRSWGETEDPILIDLERIVRQKDLRPVTWLNTTARRIPHGTEAAFESPSITMCDTARAAIYFALRTSYART